MDFAAVGLKCVGRYKFGLLTLSESYTRLEVIRQIQVGHAHSFSRLSVHHLLKDFHQKLSMKNSFFLSNQ